MPKKGTLFSWDTKERMSEAHRERWARNRERYMEAHQRAVKKKVGRPYRSSHRGVIIDQFNRMYESVRDACEKLGLEESAVRAVLRNDREHANNYLFKRVRHEYTAHPSRRRT